MPKLRTEDLNTDPIDNRWTLDKLRRAGYDLEWEKACRTCGDQIEAYKKVGVPGLLILNEATLEPHRCD